MDRHYFFAVVSALACSLALGGCGRATLEQDAEAATSPPPAAGFPAFPQFDALQTHSGSYTDTTILDGVETWQRSALAAAVGGALGLPADTAPQWAMYQFAALNPADDTNLLTLHLDSSQLPQRLYLGLSNFETMRWDWRIIDEPAADFSLPLISQISKQAAAEVIDLPPDQSIHFSPQGNLYVAVVCMGEAAQVNSVTLRVKYSALPPQDLQASDGTSTTAVELTWTDPAITYAGDPDFAYEKVVIERAINPPGPYVQIGAVQPGITEFHDPYPVVQNARTYHYRLRTVNKGLKGEAGVSDGGWVDKVPVVYLPRLENTSESHVPVFGALTAAGSNDPDGGPVTYAWDVGATGNWTDTGSDPTFTTWLLGSTAVGVRVTDDEGNTAESISDVPRSGDNLYGQSQVWRANAVGQPNPAFLSADLDGGRNTVTACEHGVIAKLDSSQDVEWVRRWDEVDFTLVACAEDGHFYAMADDTIVYFDDAGEKQWLRQLGVPGFVPRSAEVDADGALWLLGDVGIGVALCKANANESLAFYEGLNESGVQLTVAGTQHALALDGNFNEYALLSRTAAGVTRPVVVMFDAQGASLWQRVLNHGTTEAPMSLTWNSDSLLCSSTTGSTSGKLYWLDSAGLMQEARSVDTFAPRDLFGNFIGMERGLAKFFSGLNSYNACNLWTRPTASLTLYSPTDRMFGSLDLTENWTKSVEPLTTISATVSDANILVQEQTPAWSTTFLTELNGSTLTKDPTGTIFCRFGWPTAPPPPGPD